MPSRRRARRPARRSRTLSLQRGISPMRTRTRSKPSRKARLIRRVVISKPEAAKANPQSIHPPVFRVSTQDNAKSKNAALKFPAVANAHGSSPTAQKIPTVRPLNDEITQIPNPTPAAGVNATNSIGAGSPLLGPIPTETGSAAHIASITSSIPVTRNSPKTASFSALPPLLSLVPTSSIRSVDYTRAALPTESSLPSSGSTSSPDIKSHQVTAAVVVLLSVGSALFLLGVCIVIKMCARPRRPPRPTPSLPVLKDIEADNDFFETKESPMFGGDARLSSATGGNGPIWTWVQYPQTKPTPENSAHDYNTQNAYTGDPHYATRYHFATQTPTATSQTTEQISGQHALQNIPAAITSNKRLSAAAPISNSITYEQGTASDRTETTSTPESYGVAKRPKSKAASRRSRPLGAEEMRYRDSANSFVGLAYDTDVVSPGPTEYIQPMETPVIENPFEGRARVRSGYFASGYPRISTLPSASYSIATATRINVAQRSSFTKDKYTPLHQSTSKRFRDTQALTYALGLASPKTDYGAASPQPTLYPDDSMSVAEVKHGKKRNLEVVPDVPVIRPAQQGATSTDTLMTMDFGVSHMSLTGLAPDTVSEPREPEPDRHASSKPPRVPSPPPLPSLAQMALAQHNPEAYASYRSPTYSLYGLYENPDRKSLAR